MYRGVLVRRMGIFVSFSKIDGLDQQLDAQEAPDSPAVSDIDLVGGLQIIAIFIFMEEEAEASLAQWLEGIILAPELIHCVEIFGADLVIRLKSEITLGDHELDDVVPVAYGLCHVFLCSLADRELVVVLDQAFQPFRHPEKNPLLLGNQLFREEGIVHAIFVFRLVVRMICLRKNPSLRS